MGGVVGVCVCVWWWWGHGDHWKRYRSRLLKPCRGGGAVVVGCNMIHHAYWDDLGLHKALNDKGGITTQIMPAEP